MNPTGSDFPVELLDILPSGLKDAFDELRVGDSQSIQLLQQIVSFLTLVPIIWQRSTPPIY